MDPLFVPYVKNGKAERIFVEIGNRSNYEVEVRQGLDEGEAVISHPNEKIEVGVAVKSQNNNN